MGKFKPMSKMETTEPSVELKLKKGGKVKKMQMGGALPVAASPEMMPKRRRMAQSMAKPMMAAKPMARPMAQPMMSKDGGHAESKEMKKDISKDKTMIKKAVKQHDEQKHKGADTKLTLKKGGKLACKDGGGLYANIHAKQKRIAKGSGERMRKPGAEGAPSKQNFIDAAKTVKKKDGGSMGCKDGGHMSMSTKGVDGYKVGGKMCKY
jgi:hypothetical protein